MTESNNYYEAKIQDLTTIQDFVRALRDQGFILRQVHDKLQCFSPKKTPLTEQQRAFIKSRKQEILKLLEIEKQQRSIIPPVDIAQPASLSFAQQRLWFIEQAAEQANAAYNLFFTVKLWGKLDETAMLQAIQKLIDRHESLRTYFSSSEDGVPYQKILAHLTVDVLQPVTKDKLTHQVHELISRPFNLGKPPLVRIKLFKLSDYEYVFVLVKHHIISDGVSVNLFLDELNELYQSYRVGKTPELTKPSVTYAAYANWQHSAPYHERIQKQLTYWQRELSGFENLELPTDFPRPARQTFEGDSIEFYFAKAFTDDLIELAQQQQSTLFNLLQAAFVLLLSQYTQQEDILIATPIANRPLEVLESVIGFFANTLALRNQADPDISFLQLLQQVSQNSMAAFDNQEAPLETIVELLNIERDFSRNPLFQVMFSMQDFLSQHANYLGNLQVEPFPVKTQTAKVDLTLFVTKTETGLKASLEYNTSLFKQQTVQQIAQRFQKLLTAIVSSPESLLSEFSLLTNKDKQQLIQWQQPVNLSTKKFTDLAQQFIEQVKLAPDSIAVIYGENQLTYAELDRRSNQLAGYLAAYYQQQYGRSIQPGDLIAFCLIDRLLMLVSLLAITKLGAAYLPLEPDASVERVKFILHDSQAKLLLAEEKQADWMAFDYLILIDQIEIQQSINNYPVSFLTVASRPDNLAYVIYTSGSTGQPKGVMVTHGNVVNYLNWFADYSEINHHAVVDCSSAISFDLTVTTLWGALLNGARLVLGLPELKKDAQGFAAHLTQHQVNFLKLTPSYLAVLLEENNQLPTVKTIILGGEALPVSLVKRWLNKNRNDKLINEYGPTETTVGVSQFTITTENVAELDLVPIGKPGAGNYFYVLNKHLKPVPVGMPGELYVAGPSVTSGYLNRPESNAKAFIVNPFNSEVMLYKTGDKVRWLTTGELEYLGRIDKQVKIRGFRVEPDEVAAIIQKHPKVSQAAVVVYHEQVRAQIIAFYVSSDQDLELQAYLQKQLPVYMLPAQIIAVEALPLTLNDKIDQRALLAEWQKSQSEHKLPMSKLERELLSIWQELLKIKITSVEQSFFTLGGNSLLVIQLLSRLKKLFNCPLSPRVIFDHPTIRALSTYLEKDFDNQQSIVSDFSIVTRPKRIPLSYAQQRLWFLDRYEEGKTAVYNMPFAMRLRGALNISVLEQSLTYLVRRHESLRTVFSEDEQGPMQSVLTEVAVELPIVTVNEDQIKAQLVADSQVLFDLEAGPLFKVKLYKLGEADHVLLINQHHIISDGLSLMALIDELSKSYRAFMENRLPHLASLTVQYADYAVWQRQSLESSEELVRAKAYWLEQLKGCESLNLPTDYPRPRQKTYRGDYLSFTIPEELTQKICQFKNTTNTTSFMLFLSVFNLLLSRYAQQQDIVVGSPVANRVDQALEQVQGIFVNTLALRTHLSSKSTFLELLDQVKQRCLEAYSNQSLPFEELLDLLNFDRDLSQDPVFQVMLVLQDETQQRIPDFANLTVESVPLKTHTAKFDLTLYVTEVVKGFYFSFEYNTDLFKKETINRLANHYINLLTAITDQPDLMITEYPMLTQQERCELFGSWNQTAISFPAGFTLHELFQQQVKRTPDAIAISFQEQHLNYRELDEQSTQLAFYLREFGDQTLIAVCLERSLDMLIALLAVLKAGAAYLPLDPDYPEKRLIYLLEDTQVELVVSAKNIVRQFNSVWEKQQIICLDEVHAELSHYPKSGVPKSEINPTDLMYVMYTSGSTGEPKGVMLEHRSIVNRLHWMQQQYPLSDQDVVLQKTPYSFDVSVWELFWPIMVGARLCFAAPGLHADAGYLKEVIQKQAVTTLHFVPSILQLFLNELQTQNHPALTTLRHVFCSGEALSMLLVKQFQQQLPQVKLYNLYGPTEAAIDVSYWDCQGDAASSIAPIGKPIANTRLYVLDKGLKPVPIGVPGELYISGVCLARGYWRRKQLTDERFIQNIFVDLDQPVNHDFQYLYKTGDLVRWLPDGNIDYLGRIDNQIKLNGVRIELEEIETVLTKHPAVRHILVTLTQAEPKKLVAYCVLTEAISSDFNMEELRQFAQSQLPLSMVPSLYVAIDSIPLSINGKVDLKQLPRPEIETDTTDDFVAPRTEKESQLVAIWCELLQLDQVGMHDNFFSLGGDSIKSIQLLSRVREIGLKLTPKQIFAQPTIAQLAKAATNLTEQRASCLNFDKTNYLAELKSAGYFIDNLAAAYPLNPLQSGLLFHALYAPDSNQYSSQLTWDYYGELEVNKLKQAWNLLLERHESLRSAFVWKKIEEPLMLIFKQAELQWAYLDWSALSVDEQQAKLADYEQKDLAKSFEMGSPCLMRVHLIKLSKQHYYCIWNYHHILLDGWSLPILLEELTHLYTSQSLSDLPQPVPYNHYIDWLLVQNREEARYFWKQQLAGIEAATSLGINQQVLAIHKPIAIVEERSYYTSVEMMNQLKDFAQQEKVTLNAVIQLAWAIVLSRYSTQDSVVFGTTVSGRSGEVSRMEKMVGLFINTLPVRVDLDKQRSLVNHLKSLHQVIQKMNSYSYLGLNAIQQESEIGLDQPLFYCLFAYESYPESQTEVSASIQIDNISSRGKTNYPFVLHVEPGEQLELRAAFDQDCFNTDAVERLLSHVVNVLAAIFSNPQARLKDIDFLTQAEQKLIDQYNDTKEQLTGFTYLHEGFEQQVLYQSGKTALITECGQLSYAELNRLADKLAAQLLQRQIKPNQLIAVAIDRSWEQVVAVLGILKAGAAYLPLSIHEAHFRLEQILEQAEADIILSSDRQLEKFDDLNSVELLSVNQLIKSSLTQYQALPIQPSNLAYVIFTSGSTGQPKGVMTTHQAAVNTLLDINNRFQVNSEDRVLAVSALNFDLSVYDIFGVLAAGGTVVMPTDESVNKPKALSALVEQHQITIWNSVPALMQLLVDHSANNPSSLQALRLVLLSGDWIPLQLPVTIWEYAGNSTKVISLGGATEGAIWSIHYPIKTLSSDWKSIPYGKPLANQKIYVLDGELQQVPVGIIGELCIAGEGVAAGYWKDQERTEAQFINLPSGERVYRTGDLGRLNESGLIEFLGRQDTQVKVRGFRVELGEIEAVLAELEAVEQAVVLLEKEQLIAFYKASDELTEQVLRHYLSQRLPAYMEPALILAVEEFPLTANGKIDRKQLLEQAKQEQLTTTTLLPRDQLELELQLIWQAIFDLDTIGVQERFTDLGGHSLLAIQLISRINEYFDCDLAVSWIFANSSIAHQAVQLRQQVQVSQSLIYTFNEGADSPPLFLIHPGGGGSEAYVALTQKLASDQPAYGIDPYNLNTDDECITDIKKLAQLYIHEMKKVKPQGPCFLGGWSLGGLIAFEMALQLEAEGERVAGLYLLDAYLFNEPLKQQFRDIPWQSVFNLLKQKDDYYRSLPAVYQQRYLRSFKAENEAILTYQAAGTIKNALLIKAVQQPEQQVSLFYQIPEYLALWQTLANKNNNGWEQFVENLVTIEVTSSHHELLNYSNIEKIAAAIQSDINEKRMELVDAQ